MNDTKQRHQRRKPSLKNSAPKDKPGLAARQVATTLLTRIVDDGRGLDGLLDTRHGPAALRDMPEADRLLVRAIVTTALRHRGEIEHALDRCMDRKPPKNARQLIHALHVAAAQILFMEVPDSAAVDLAVTALSSDQRSTRFSGLANAVLRRMGREKDTLFEAMSDEARAVINMPPWLRKRTRKSYGKERLASIAMRHMQEPVIDICVRENPEEWAEKLGGVHLFGNAVRVMREGAIHTWPGYDDGGWWVQDAAAQLPAQLMGDIDGKRVLDLCAAPGGKTAQLAAAGASVTALELNASRLHRLKGNMERLKLDVETIEGDLFEYEPAELFDAVLLDAPCSSLGTIRRHPDVQWAKSQAIVEELADLQKRMCEHAATFIKPGGTLIFANCSLDRAEGEDVVAAITKGAAPLELSPLTPDDLFGLDDFITGQGTVRTHPGQLNDVPPPTSADVDPARYGGLDGFFAARFIRTA
ncbi:RsmB/NOP family class I SAM-dependent RNA methyltransferase [Ahrensia sp. R2A130]|uniref:RsmB/NOP family class I SAM-dependent RNA methyltransferase n=1 Tax=Ahrensia sp. R2A130 TaxID=744979 RepID=UPI0001E0AC81|nr:transcription antitermination factor NusB [Ahrensia sp. R2A130]EFL89682.1 ribosomal RNA small subunit methyltransferase B [Ahrensia sp. R2A130]